MEATDTWTVDPTIRVDHVYVIEAFSGGWAGRTGTRLFEQLEPLCAGLPVRPALHRVNDRAELRTLLQRVLEDAVPWLFPVVAFRNSRD